MKLLTQQDVLSHEEYERQREAFRSRIIALKQRRRISVGPLIVIYHATPPAVSAAGTVWLTFGK